ncbi:putative sugar transporter [Exophiala viscosa]|uniref:Sugar transporter n=1 Tax=Exophiala viscosa TaxID=2486360 RepID=A0AAN6E3H0_9EURO|nr:putative sugar transporter [Exophiala viscosa]
MIGSAANLRPFFGLRGLRLKLAMIMLVVAPSFLLFGFNNGSTGGVGHLESFVKVFPSIDTINTTGAEKSHKATILGVVTACYDLGAVAGALSCIAFGDRIGRLRSIFAGLVLAVIALALESSAYSLAQFVVSRLLIGGAIGIISASIPIWQTECATTKHRGMFVIVEGIFISAGIAMSEWIAFGFSEAFDNSAQWRVTIVFPVWLAFFVMPVLFFMPESPRWLARKGRFEEARSIIAAVMDKDNDSHEVNAEMNHIEYTLESTRGDMSLLFKNTKERYLHRAIIAAWAQAMTQLCGCSALIFYTGTTFADLGYTGKAGSFLSCGFTIHSPMTVDRFGRRRLFMLSLSGLAIAMAVMAGTSNEPRLAKVTVAFMFIYAFFYPLGFLGLPFLYAGEISGLKMRMPISAIAVSAQWLSQFVVGQVTPAGTANLSNRYWIIYAVLNAAFIPSVYLFFPETNDRSLEEMDRIFDQSSIFNVVRHAKELPRESQVVAEHVDAK